MNEATLAFELNTGIFDALEILAADSVEDEGAIDAPLKASRHNTERTYALISVAVFITAGPSIKPCSYQICH